MIEVESCIGNSTTKESGGRGKRGRYRMTGKWADISRGGIYPRKTAALWTVAVMRGVIFNGSNENETMTAESRWQHELG